MKKGVITTAVMMIGLAVQAQEDAISRFFEEYESDASFSNVHITARMFGLLTDLEMEDKEEQEVLEAISKLKGLKVLAKDDVDNGKVLYREALGLLPSREFDELMSVRDEDKDMKFMIKEKNGKVEELVMVMGGNREFFILTLFGEIDLKQVARISKAMDIDGLEGLENIKGN